MNAQLLDQFLSEDCDAHVHRKLLTAIHKQRASGVPGVQRYTFNRFNITLNFVTKQVSLEDDLAVGPQGEYKLGIEEFEEILQKRK